MNKRKYFVKTGSGRNPNSKTQPLLQEESDSTRNSDDIKQNTNHGGELHIRSPSMDRRGRSRSRGRGQVGEPSPDQRGRSAKQLKNYTGELRDQSPKKRGRSDKNPKNTAGAASELSPENRGRSEKHGSSAERRGEKVEKKSAWLVPKMVHTRDSKGKKQKVAESKKKDKPQPKQRHTSPERMKKANAVTVKLGEEERDPPVESGRYTAIVNEAARISSNLAPIKKMNKDAEGLFREEMPIKSNYHGTYNRLKEETPIKYKTRDTDVTRDGRIREESPLKKWLNESIEKNTKALQELEDSKQGKLLNSMPRSSSPVASAAKRNLRRDSQKGSFSTLKLEPRYSTGYNNVHSFDSRDDISCQSSYTNSTMDFSHMSASIDYQNNSVYSGFSGSHVESVQERRGSMWNKRNISEAPVSVEDDTENQFSYCNRESSRYQKKKKHKRKYESFSGSLFDFKCGQTDIICGKKPEWGTRESNTAESNSNRKRGQQGESDYDENILGNLESCKVEVPFMDETGGCKVQAPFGPLFTSKTNQKTCSMFLILSTMVLFWTLLYMCMERWSFIDSLYFVIQIITSVGFGDLIPETTFGMILFPFVSFGGICLTIITSARIAIFLYFACKFITPGFMIVTLGVIFGVFGYIFMQVEDWTVWQASFFLYSCASLTGLDQVLPESSQGKWTFCILMVFLIQAYTVIIKLFFAEMRFVINNGRGGYGRK